MVMADSESIQVHDLGLDVERTRSTSEDLFDLPLAGAVAEFERRYFAALLPRHATKANAATAAGLTYEGLRQALKRLALSEKKG